MVELLGDVQMTQAQTKQIVVKKILMRANGGNKRLSQGGEKNKQSKKSHEKEKTQSKSSTKKHSWRGNQGRRRYGIPSSKAKD